MHSSYITLPRSVNKPSALCDDMRANSQILAMQMSMPACQLEFLLAICSTTDMSGNISAQFVQQFCGYTFASL